MPPKRKQHEQRYRVGKVSPCMPGVSELPSAGKNELLTGIREVSLKPRQSPYDSKMLDKVQAKQNSSKDIGFCFWRPKSQTRAISAPTK